MKEIIDLFSNRELALITWVFFFSICLLTWRKTRRSSFHLIKTFFNKKLIFLQLVIWSYVAGVIWIFSKLEFWNWTMLKDSIIWILFSAFILMFGMLTAKKKNRHIKQTLLESFKLIVIVEFIVNIYSFSYITEMILLPVMAFVAILIAFAETNPQHKIVANFFNWILAIWGVYVLYSSGRQIYMHIDELATKQTALDFLMPLWLTFLYIPLLILVKKYNEWEQKNLMSKIRKNK